MHTVTAAFVGGFTRVHFGQSSLFTGAACKSRLLHFRHGKRARASLVPPFTMTASTSRSSTEQFASLFGDESDALVLRDDGSNLSLTEFVRVQNEAGKAVLLGWLRHFGCTLCKKQVADWRDWMPQLNQNEKLTIAFIGNGPVSQLAEFRDEMEWSEFLFTDPSRTSYAALNFNKKIGDLLNRPALKAVISSFKSHPQTWSRLPTDALQQGGVVLVNRDGFVTFFHADAYAGDHVSKDVLLEAVTSATT